MNLQLASADVISNFLNNAVMNHLSRESAGTSALRSETAGVESFSAIDDAPTIGLRVLPAPDLSATFSRIPTWKRILDVALITLALPIWLPFMLLIMVAIKVTSAGPIFYRQERVGYRGRRFMIFKFRTMKVNVDTQVHESHFERLIATDSPMTKLDEHGDPRLIRWGRFYRAAGLDELPQIFNVLRGEMSLVGARPCTLHEFERYQPWQRERVNGPPGLTGYWQVNGKNKTTFSEMIEMDIFYGKNMSLGLDLRIIFRTPMAILQQVLESRGLKFW
ncbi:MAG: sugar transferase [Chthoniobacterales bacterium]